MLVQHNQCSLLLPVASPSGVIRYTHKVRFASPRLAVRRLRVEKHTAFLLAFTFLHGQVAGYDCERSTVSSFWLLSVIGCRLRFTAFIETLFVIFLSSIGLRWNFRAFFGVREKLNFDLMVTYDDPVFNLMVFVL